MCMHCSLSNIHIHHIIYISSPMCFKKTDRIHMYIMFVAPPIASTAYDHWTPLPVTLSRRMCCRTSRLPVMPSSVPTSKQQRGVRHGYPTAALRCGPSCSWVAPMSGDHLLLPSDHMISAAHLGSAYVTIQYSMDPHNVDMGAHHGVHSHCLVDISPQSSVDMFSGC